MIDCTSVRIWLNFNQVISTEGVNVIAIIVIQLFPKYINFYANSWVEDFAIVFSNKKKLTGNLVSLAR